MAPRVAGRLNTGLTADCTHLDVSVAHYIKFAEENTTLNTATLNPDDPDESGQSNQHQQLLLKNLLLRLPYQRTPEVV